MILDAWRVLLESFLCFFLDFAILGAWEQKRKEKGAQSEKKTHLLLGVIFDTFATLCAACFSGVFLGVTFLHFL